MYSFGRDWGLSRAAALSTESAAACALLSAFVESYVTFATAILRPNVIFALAANSWAMLSLTDTAKALLCMDTMTSVLASNVLTFAGFLSHFFWINICSFTVFVHWSVFTIPLIFFPLQFFFCSRLGTKNQDVSHDCSFVYLQQFTVIEVTGFLVGCALLPMYYCSR